MILRKIIPDERLTAIFVDTLKDFIGSCVAETWEEGEESARN
jgi:hypothetical protein